MFFGGLQQTTYLGGLAPSGIYTDGLIGDFDPNNTGSYIGTGTRYNNLAPYPDLELKNGISFVSGESPKHFAFDGVDDYIGPYEGYEAKFTLNLEQGFTISSWWKFIEAGSELTDGALFGCGNHINSSGVGILTHADTAPGGIGSRKGNITIETQDPDDIYGPLYDAQSARIGDKIEYLFEDQKWYMISVTKESGSDYFNLYIGPSYEPLNNHLLFNASLSGAPFNIGKSFEASHTVIDGTENVYANHKFRVGRVLVYEKPLKNSQIRRNYFATKKTY